MSKTSAQVAEIIFKYCLSNNIEGCFLSTLTNEDVVRMIAQNDLLDSCPKCGSMAGCNIDCEPCNVYFELGRRI